MSSGKGVDNLSHGVSNISLGSSEDGTWEEVTRKQKNKAGSSAVRQWGQWGQHNSTPKAWGQPDTAQRLGMRSGNAPGGAWNTPSNNLRRQGGSAPQSASSERQNVTGSSHSQMRKEKVAETEEDKDDADAAAAADDDDDEVYTDDDDDDYLLSDGSDECPSHETKKQHRLLKAFFEMLDKLTVEEVNEPERQWHCPACQGGPGAIDWYKGLQPLLAHAKTKGSHRVKLHRTFCDLLNEELRRKGTSVVPAGELFRQWEGLKQETKDFEIVWPPTMLIMNTYLDKDENDKWLGMGNQELLDYFKDYAAVRAKHSYGPKGHRGMSVLIFESSAMGYVEAERLHKHFIGQGTGRAAWESNRKALFYPGGKRQLYGFLARKEDLDEFNRHCPGKTRVKFDIMSYQEMVVVPMKQMSEENQQLTWFKNKFAKEQRRSVALEESFNIVSEKLRKTMEENRIVRQRTKMQHEQNKEEMDYQEQFFKDQIQKIRQTIDEKEDDFEKLQQEERKKVEDSESRASNTEDLRHRAEEVSKFKQLQEQEMEKFVAEREEVIRDHEERKMVMKKKHWEEELQLEREFDAALTKLMDKYAPRPAEGGAAVAGGGGGNAR